MQQAIETEDLEKIEEMLQNGSDPDEKIDHGQTLLFQTTNVKIIKLLLEYGADPKTVDEYGFSISDYTDNPEILSLINSECKPVKFKNYKCTYKSKGNRGKTKKILVNKNVAKQDEVKDTPVDKKIETI